MQQLPPICVPTCPGGFSFIPRSPHIPPMHHEELLTTIHDCHATCEHMINHLMTKPDFHLRRTQIQLLHDCADICALTAKYIARLSTFAKPTANLCASICEACGHECSKFPDAESQNCSKECLRCARECRNFAMM